MKTFGSYLKEEEVQAANVRSGTVDIRDPGVRAQINAALAAATDEGVSNPYVALQEIAKVLSRFHIYIPNQAFLEDNYGVATWPVNQFGFKVGMDDKAAFIEAGDSGYTVYFEYQLNDKGSFTIFCEVIDEEELDDILKDLEEEDGPEMDDLNEEFSAGDTVIHKKHGKFKIKKIVSMLNRPNSDQLHSPTVHYTDESGRKYMSKLKSFAKNVTKIKEESENLQELSKSTLKSYIRQAADDKTNLMATRMAAQNKWMMSGTKRIDSKMNNRDAGIERALNKLEETEQLQELSKKTIKSYIKKASANLVSRADDEKYHGARAGVGPYMSDKKFTSAMKHGREQEKAAKDVEKRQSGLRTAIRKLEEQPLQELSRGKLADYVAAASTDMANRLKKSHQELSNATMRHNRGDKPAAVQAHADVADKESKKASKRQRGIYKAVRKLAETKT